MCFSLNLVRRPLLPGGIGEFDLVRLFFGCVAIAVLAGFNVADASRPAVARYCAEAPKPAPEQEIAACSRLIARSDNVAASFFRRANAELRLHEFDIAIRDYDTAIALEPRNATFFEGRGNAWNEKGDHTRAVRDYDRAVNLNPRAAEVLDNRCWAKAAWLGDISGALADCERALRLRPGHGNTLENLGFVFLRQGRLAKSIASYSAALTENPRRPDSLFGRGIARQRIGRSVAAEADLAAARSLNSHVDAEYARYGIKPAP